MNADIDIRNVILKTDRLILRPWRLADLDDFFAYASVDGVGQMAGWPPHKSKTESLQVLQYFIDPATEGKTNFAIEYNGKVIGSLSLKLYNENVLPELANLQCREIGYVLAKDYWGRGFMPEALAEVIKYAFADLKLDALGSGYFVHNTQSASVQEKCGFKFHKKIEIETLLGTVEEMNCLLLQRDDWCARLKNE